VCSQRFVAWADEVSNFVLGVLDAICFLLSLFFLVFLTVHESENEKGVVLAAYTGASPSPCHLGPRIFCIHP